MFLPRRIVGPALRRLSHRGRYRKRHKGYRSRHLTPPALHSRVTSSLSLSVRAVRAYGPGMRDPAEVIESTADVVERTKLLLQATDDRLRVSRLQLERSRQLLERFANLESGLKKLTRGQA
jgi:hypothetical protein